MFNLGGIHRMLARAGRYVASASARPRLAELSLPGGETMVDDNYVRLGTANRSLTSQLVIALDDIGYSANTGVGVPQRSILRQRVIVADTCASDCVTVP